VRFADRKEAGRRLAVRLGHHRGTDAVVLGLPRGGVPVAAEVAAALDLPLDVILVRKLGVPGHPELAMGAIGEDGVMVVDELVVRAERVRPEWIEAVARRERDELERRAARYRDVQDRVPLDSRTAIVVDDGIATGSTARAACAVARRHGAGRVVLAAPVGPSGAPGELGPIVDELVLLHAPARFRAVGRWYRDFTATTDDEVLELLRGGEARRPG
jgi:putative phosphoribosyl transferase